MNLRQKYKKAKQRLEILEGKTVPFKIEQSERKVYTYKAIRHEDIDIFNSRPYIRELMIKDMLNEISDGVRQFVEIKETVDTYAGVIHIIATINVVKPKEE